MDPNKEQKLFAREYKNFSKSERDPLPNPHDWLLQKQVIDNIANDGYMYDKQSLWRIHDKLYDFTNFKNHPGGYTFIDMAKNSDITELFESSHYNIEKAEALLSKYYVADCAKEKERNSSKFTFKKDGFYVTLRSKVQKYLLNRKSSSYFTSSAIVHDLLFLGFIVLWLQIISPTERASSTLWVLEICCGILLGLLGVCAHTFYHNADSWRIYTFDLSMYSSYEWRISHVFSHHVFPNSAMDYEVSAFEPYLYFFPYQWKQTSPLLAVRTLLFMGLGFALIPYLTSLKRILMVPIGKCTFRWEYLLFIYFFAASCVLHLYWTGGSFDWAVIGLLARRFAVMQSASSLLFLHIGLTATHHHPNIWHSGDEQRIKEYEEADGSMDWGIFQIFAVGYRPAVDDSWVLSSVTFGQHSLHHMFPTLDPSVLAELYPILYEVCREFKILHLVQENGVSENKKRKFTVWDSWKGMFLQCLRFRKY